MVFMRKETFSGVSITRLVDRCPGRHFWPIFLSVWLKRCVVSSPSSDIILPTVLLPAVCLVHGRCLGLLLAMVCCIQRGLRALTEAFCRPPMTKRKKCTILPRDGPNPRIGLPYTYLMAWFGLHCPAIIPVSYTHLTLPTIYSV